jgi:hypothetical protein
MEGTLKYAVVAPKHPGNLVTFEFALDDKLIGITFNPDATDAFKLKAAANLPLLRRVLFDKGGPYEGCEVKQLTIVDLTFNAFWNQYNYKMGNKARVCKKWDELPEEDRIQALAFIRRYKNWCDRKKIEYCFPETYLNQRRWENLID